MQRVGAPVLQALERGAVERRGARVLCGGVSPRCDGAGGRLGEGGGEGWNGICEWAEGSRRGGDGARGAVGGLCSIDWRPPARSRGGAAADRGVCRGVDGWGGSAGALGGAVCDRGGTAGDLEDQAGGADGALR